VCELIRAIGEYRKGDKPRITGYEFHVLTLATYVAPKYLVIDKLEDTLKELKTRKPEDKEYRARVVLVGSEMDDSDFIKLIEDTGAYVCADRFCYGSLPGRNPIELNDDEDALTQVCRHIRPQLPVPAHDEHGKGIRPQGSMSTIWPRNTMRGRHHIRAGQVLRPLGL
jgi:benzoyl-CoA reductase/2-hydroxyglutaryl-CoA dehydratase subunit BcrC/BadD/HgdB